MGRKRATERKTTTTVQFTDRFLDYIQAECDRTGHSMGSFLEASSIGGANNEKRALTLAQDNLNKTQLELQLAEVELKAIQAQMGQKIANLKVELRQKERAVAEAQKSFEESFDFVLYECSTRAIPLAELALAKFLSLGILAISPDKGRWLGSFDLTNWIAELTPAHYDENQKQDAIDYIKGKPKIQLSKVEIARLIEILNGVSPNKEEWHLNLGFALHELDAALKTSYYQRIIGPIWPDTE